MSLPTLGVWPPLPLAVHARWRRRDLPFPLDAPGCLVFARARHALRLGLQAIEMGAGSEVLMPAFNHGSEVEALTRAGVACRFYGGTPRLEPDEAELAELLTPSVRALYLIHYLGFPQHVAHWRRWCSERGLYLIEDAAQAWLATSNGRPVGMDGDLSIFCLYKTYGLPDGAALHLSTTAPSVAFRRRRAGVALLLRRHAAWIAAHSRVASALLERVQRKAPYDSAADFALGDEDSPPSVATTFLLPRVTGDDAAARRCANYGRLLEAVSTMVAPPFDVLPTGASPFGFPLEVDDREASLAHLRRRGIGASAFWCASHPAIPAGRFPAVVARRERTLLLPVHQELTRWDVDRIAAAAHALRPTTRTPVPVPAIPVAPGAASRGADGKESVPQCV